MLESKVHRKLIEQLEKEGYYVIKLSVTNKNGIADILALPPGCSAEFYEVKQKGKRPAPLQIYRANELKKYGIKTYLYDGEKEEL